jgi:hypothetical protein
MRYILLLFITLFTFTAKAQYDENIGNKASGSATKTPESLSDYVCAEATTEYQKVNAIYNWITQNITFDAMAIKKGDAKTQSAKNVLSKRSALSDGFVNLFIAMCTAQNIQAEKVEGYYKGWTFDNGTKLYNPDHVWVAVNINGKWQLVDPAFGSGVMKPVLTFPNSFLAKIFKKKNFKPSKEKFVHRVDSTYFSTAALNFRETHLPADPKWQLTDSIMPIEVFETGSNAVKKYNKAHPQSTFTPSSKYATITSEETKLNESIERTMAYNPNYKSKLVERYLMQTQENYEQLNFKSRGDNDAIMVDSTKVLLEKTKVLLEDENKIIKKKYTYLKSRSQEKQKITDDYSKKLKTSATNNIKTCNKAIEKNNKSIAKYLIELKKIKNQKSVPETKAILGVENVLEIKRLQDINKEDVAKYAKTKTDFETLAKTIKTFKDRGDSLYQALNSTTENASEELVLELRNRNRMYDDFDDEVIDHATQVKQLKFEKADTLFVKYKINSDSVDAKIKRHISMHDAMIAQLKMQAQTLNNLYRNGDKTAINKYNDRSDEADELLVQKNDVIKDYLGYVQDQNRKQKVLAQNQNIFINGAQFVTKSDMHRMLSLKTYTNQLENFEKNTNEKNISIIKRQIDNVKNFKRKKK